MTAPAPDAVLGVPLTRVGTHFHVGFGVVMFGQLTALLVPLQTLVPLQVSVFAGESKAGAFAAVSTAGAVVGIIAAPLVGMASDRTRTRWGRRRPWLVISGIVSALGLVALGAARDFGLLVVAFALLHAGLGGLVAAVMAMVADQVPTAQRGEMSGVVGIASAIGPVSGAWLFSLVAGDLIVTYSLLAAVMIVGTGVAVAIIKEPSSRSMTVRAARWRGWRSGLSLDPRGRPDLGWAWATRFLVFLGMALSMGFIVYWVQDVLALADTDTAAVADRMAVPTSAYAVAMIASTLLAGIWSDRLGRRKVFVVWAALVLAASTISSVIWPSWTGIVILSAVTGLAFGVYSTIDLAIAADVLPETTGRARDLGVLQSAITFPSLAGPLLGAVILASGFVALFVSAAVCMAGAAYTVTRIRAVG